jgi:hypothetical protein
MLRGWRGEARQDPDRAADQIRSRHQSDDGCPVGWRMQFDRLMRLTRQSAVKSSPLVCRPALLLSRLFPLRVLSSEHRRRYFLCCMRIVRGNSMTIPLVHKLASDASRRPLRIEMLLISSTLSTLDWGLFRSLIICVALYVFSSRVYKSESDQPLSGSCQIPQPANGKVSRKRTPDRDQADSA